MTQWTQGMTPVRVATIRKTDGHVAEVNLGVDSLAPDGDIVGRSAQVVKDIVAGDSGLSGAEPHLVNAICGLFACVAHQYSSRGARAASSRINWNPTHDLEMTIGGSRP